MESNGDMHEPCPAAGIHKRIRTSWKPQSSGCSRLDFRLVKSERKTVIKLPGLRRPRNDRKNQTTTILHKRKNSNTSKQEEPRFFLKRPFKWNKLSIKIKTEKFATLPPFFSFPLAGELSPRNGLPVGPIMPSGEGCSTSWEHEGPHCEPSSVLVITFQGYRCILRAPCLS